MTDAKPVFPFNSLTCTQTPFQFPKLLKVGDLPEYKTSEIRIIGSTPGPGRLLERAVHDGQLIEENPQISLMFERQRFTISDTILHFPGMHRGPGESTPAGEIHMYFRNQKPAKRLQQIRDDLCLIIPIKVGTGKGANYFEFLNRDAALRSQYLPSITSILTDKTPAILYTGKDLKNRGYGLPNPDSQCLPDSYAIQFIFLQTPINIRVKDVERLKGDHRVIELEPPSDPVNVVDLRRFCALYKTGLRVGSATESPVDLPAGIKPMDSLKCRPIDPKKDIRGDKIVVDKNARKVFLADELYGPKKLEDDVGLAGAPSTSSTIQPGDFEDILAAPVGIFIGGFVLGGGVLWGLLSVCYRH